MTPVTITPIRHFACPNGCDHRFNVEHMFGRAQTAGPWYCDDCGQGWNIASDGERVSVEKATANLAGEGDGKLRKCFVTLEIPPQRESIFFKVRGMLWTPTITEETAERQRYYYEEHTCPTNWLRNVEEIRIGDDADPHGLAQFVAVYNVDAEGEQR